MDYAQLARQGYKLYKYYKVGKKYYDKLKPIAQYHSNLNKIRNTLKDDEYSKYLSSIPGTTSKTMVRTKKAARKVRLGLEVGREY